MMRYREVGYGFIRSDRWGLMMTGTHYGVVAIPFKNRPNRRSRKQEAAGFASKQAGTTLILLTVLSCLFVCAPAFAEIKVFEKEYTYEAGEDDSKNSSRAIALREVKRLLLEELGAYLESRTEVKDFRLTRDEVTTLTAGIVSTQIIAEKWDGRVYYLKAKLAAYPDDVIKSIDEFRKDSEKTRELEAIRKSLGAMLAENEKLKRELALAKDAKKPAALAAYEKNIGALDAFEWFERGYANDASGNCTEAVKDYDRAVQLNPGYALAYDNRGKCYIKLKDYLQAVRDFDKAIALGPEVATTHYNRANAYNRLGDYRRAIMDFDRAIDLDPRLAVAYNNRGNVYYRLGNYRKALTDFNSAIALEPGFAIAYYNRGNTNDRLGNRRQAIADLVRAARQGHENARMVLRARGVAW
jgi:tetratricopeptide (TPR) repeat protein